MNFDEYRAVPNDKEPDDACDQLWRRWGSENRCAQAAAVIVVLDPGPGYAIMCQEHFNRFHDAQKGRGYKYEPYTRERALEIKAATTAEVQS
jgi:hypothetical protein